MLDKIKELIGEAEAFTGNSLEEVEAFRIKFLGKKGLFNQYFSEFKNIPNEQKKAFGQTMNQLKTTVQDKVDTLKASLETTEEEGVYGDLTRPGDAIQLGSRHPISVVKNQIIEIFSRIGFDVSEGPEIEDDWHNFVALNIPDDHPARDPLENFYLATAEANSGEKNPVNLLLRSQTSTVQIRVMEDTKPPIRIISLGRVYRPDTADATHYPMFHQIEGLMIDTNVTMADLKSVLRLFATSYLGDDVTIRFRPSFFPFTEPSVEADYYWNGQWVEFGGAGMVDPNVLTAVGYDPEEVTGFAFGLGVERLCMRRHGITDIREFYKNDVRFLAQF